MLYIRKLLLFSWKIKKMAPIDIEDPDEGVSTVGWGQLLVHLPHHPVKQLRIYVLCQSISYIYRLWGWVELKVVFCRVYGYKHLTITNISWTMPHNSVEYQQTNHQSLQAPLFIHQPPLTPTTSPSPPTYLSMGERFGENFVGSGNLTMT